MQLSMADEAALIVARRVILRVSPECEEIFDTVARSQLCLALPPLQSGFQLTLAVFGVGPSTHDTLPVLPFISAAFEAPPYRRCEQCAVRDAHCCLPRSTRRRARRRFSFGSGAGAGGGAASLSFRFSSL
jgi:hypothetical protein